MKLSMNLKIMNYFVLLLTISFINSTVLKNYNTRNSDASPQCENSCQICQRTVYQLKFQKIADCDYGEACRGTCYKIKETWGTNWSPFEPFEKDQFGKCDICFRAGYCSISDCKDQETKELDIINSVINKATLTAKIDENLLKNLPEISKTCEKDISQTKKNNISVLKKLSKTLDNSIKTKNSAELVPKVQNLIKVYFAQPFEPVEEKISDVFFVKNQLNANDITYWNAQANNDVVKAKKKSEDVVQKLKNQLAVLENAKQTKDKIIKAQIGQAVKATEKSLKSAERQYAKTESKVFKKEKKINKLLNSENFQDPKTKAALSDSLRQIQDVKSNVSSVKNEIKKLENKLKSL